jgi:hypothetical protein
MSIKIVSNNVYKNDKFKTWWYKHKFVQYYDIEIDDSTTPLLNFREHLIYYIDKALSESVSLDPDHIIINLKLPYSEANLPASKISDVNSIVEDICDKCGFGKLMNNKFYEIEEMLLCGPFTLSLTLINKNALA